MCAYRHFVRKRIAHAMAEETDVIANCQDMIILRSVLTYRKFIMF